MMVDRMQFWTCKMVLNEVVVEGKLIEGVLIDPHDQKSASIPQPPYPP